MELQYNSLGTWASVKLPGGRAPCKVRYQCQESDIPSLHGERKTGAPVRLFFLNSDHVSPPLTDVILLVALLCPALYDPKDYSPQRSMEFSRQEYWSGLPLSSPGDLPNPGIEPRYPALQANS